MNFRTMIVGKILSRGHKVNGIGQCTVCRIEFANMHKQECPKCLNNYESFLERNKEYEN